MTKSDKIVRVRKIDNTNETVDCWSYDIYLTTFKDYLSDKTYKSYGQTIELYRYRWYEIERLWEVPFYHIRLSSFEDGRELRAILANKMPLTKATIRLVIWTVPGIAMFILTEYLLRPLLKSWFHLG